MKKANGVVYFRRKREGRTNYHTRLSLLKSRLPRLVVRKTNKHIILQAVQYLPDGDKVLATITTQHLLKNGWKGATGNSAAAYAAGLLLAKKLKEIKFKEELIVDIGLHTHKAHSRIYSAVRGVKDGEIAVRCGEKILPEDSRLQGEHLSEDVRKSLAALKK